MKWHPNHIRHNSTEPVPINLLLLGSLRYLGRGWTFDDLEEATGICMETHRLFFHQFVKCGETVLYKLYVKYPTNAKEVETHMREYRAAGIPGSPGSMDACHVVMEKCSHRLKQNHLGGKSKLTCRSFNLTSNHRKRILHTTPGHPARWNDKTIVLFDEFATKLRNGEIMNDN